MKFLWTMQAEYILDLQKQITLLGSETRKDSNGSLTEESITTMAPADKVSIGFYMYSFESF